MTPVEFAELIYPLGKALGWADPDPTAIVITCLAGPEGGREIGGGAIREAEAEIARRGLQAAYIIAIGESMGFDMNTVPVTQLPPIFWAFLTATPEVRVRALLRALGEG